MPHEFFSHTGDIGARVWADSLDGLFEAALVALADAVTDLAQVQARESVTLSCRAPQLDLLLHDFLSDALFHLDARRLLPRSASVSVTGHGDEWSLQARLSGETLDPARHPIRVLVKAVTYHALEVRQSADGWRATLVLDI
jgi:SHS2 domain-containing protein